MKINFNPVYTAVNNHTKVNTQKKVSFGNGLSDDWINGWNKGYNEGWNDGWNDCWNNNKNEGFKAGRKEWSKEVKTLKTRITQLEADKVQLQKTIQRNLEIGARSAPRFDKNGGLFITLPSS